MLFNARLPETWDTHLVSTDPHRHREPHSGLLGTHPALASPALIPRPPAGWKLAAVTDGMGSQENAPHQGAGEQPEHLSRGGRRKQEHI